MDDGEKRAVLEQIIATVPHRIFWKDRELRFLGGNDKLLRDLGLRSLVDLVGKTDYDFFPAPQAAFFRKCDQDVMASGQPLLDIEEPQDQEDGTHWLLTSKVPLRDDAGFVSGLLGIYTDITERKRTEEALRVARDEARAAAEAKSEFLAVMSHELRTPLTLILGPLELLLSRGRRAPLEGDVRDELERVQRNAGRLLLLVNDVLDFSKAQAGRLRVERSEADVAKVVAQLVADARPAAERAGIALALEIAPGDAIGARLVDRRKLEQILLNLVGNALKVTPPRGQVTVGLAAVDEGRAIELSVTDTGPGIAEADKARLFRRFEQIDHGTTRKHEGTGLGLALVKELSELLGGAVSVESEPGRGARFVVRLPAIRTESKVAVAGVPTPAVPSAGLDEPGDLATTRDHARFAFAALPLDLSLEPRDDEGGHEEPANAARPGRPRVLLADDNADLRQHVRRILEEEYDVEAVANGRLALAAAERRTPDVVVSDVMMPELDGHELVARMRRSDALAHVPVILLTARAGREELARGLDRGATDYLAKPFSAVELRARVGVARRLRDAYLEISRKHDELARTNEALRSTQEQLVHAAKIAAVGTLVAGLSHELNNPLSIILMNAQALKTTHARDPEAAERSIATIEKHTRRCARLVDTLLDFSRKKSPSREPVRAPQLFARVAELAQLRARRADVELRVTCDERVPPALLCLHEMETALTNLVHNAVDATPRGGSIDVLAAPADRGRQRGLELCVEDTGHGIPEEAMPHVFDPFYTTKPAGHGTGLGLSLARKIVEDHGGEVRLESREGHGTRVTIWLPAAPDGLEGDHAAPHPPEAGGHEAGDPGTA